MSDPVSLNELIARFGKAYTAFLHSKMAECGSTPARTQLLATVAAAGSLKMADISERLGVTPRNVTKLVDALESEGLLERVAHPTDRRVTMITLTAEGVASAKSCMMQFDEAKELFDCLNARDQQDMRRVTGRLLAELERRGFTSPCERKAADG
ncbi:MAG: MarR family transcriptional regulator [Planctomycetota bacterium]